MAEARPILVVMVEDNVTPTMHLKVICAVVDFVLQPLNKNERVRSTGQKRIPSSIYPTSCYF